MPDGSEERLLFVQCELETLEAGRFRARAVLEDGNGTSFEGSSEQEGENGDLKSSAEAAVEALRTALEISDEDLRLKDVTAFDISDSPAVAVSLRMRTDGEKRTLFGLSQAEDDRGKAAVLAVLGATNRVLTK